MKRKIKNINRIRLVNDDYIDRHYKNKKIDDIIKIEDKLIEAILIGECKNGEK